MAIYTRKIRICAKAIVDAKTKELVKRLNCNQIAILRHEQLDSVAAKDLIKRKPLAVINFSRTITSTIPSNGANIILSAGILLLDVISNEHIFSELRDEMLVEISMRKGIIHIPEINKNARFIQITQDFVNEKLVLAKSNYNQLFFNFLSNTLEYALKERNAFVEPFPKLPLYTDLHKRKVVIVTRGSDAVEDFAVILPYVKKEKPILIGVDGGADIILMFGLIPDMVVGDMDSVSDEALKKIRDRIIHAYPTGKSPGLERIQKLQLEYHILPFVGTSEDVAILLAYEHGVEKIILVGSHTHMLDFLEKGREGMASTVLTRMKTGHLITDIKGIHTIVGKNIGEVIL